MSKQQTHIVDTPDLLRALLKALVQHDMLSIDTEFHSENRYYPSLMLLQIGDMKGNAWLIDPLAVQVEPLGQVLKHKTLLVHGGTEDIKLLYHHLGLRPKKVFDVQIASGLLGLSYPQRLSKIVEHFLDIAVSKDSALTDWSHRPLTPQQIEYAANDVQLLPKLFEKIHAQLAELNRESWAWEASQEMVDQSLRPKDAGKEWIYWPIAKALDLPAQRVLTRLLIWREGEALDRNKPLNYILPRRTAISLARSRPESIEELRSNRKVHRGLIKKHGLFLIDCIREAQYSEDGHLFPTEEQQIKTKLLRSWGLLIAHEHSIDRNLLISKELAQQIIAKGVQVCHGWRASVLKQKLSLFISGQEGIFIDPSASGGGELKSLSSTIHSNEKTMHSLPSS